MFPLLSLPVELQIEVLCHCGTVELRRLKSSCRLVKSYIDTSAALDGVMFRIKKVDMALIERQQAEEEAFAIASGKYTEQESEYDEKHALWEEGDSEQTNMPERPVSPQPPRDIHVQRHPLIDLGYWFGQNFEKVRAYSGKDPHKKCRPGDHRYHPCGKDEDDLPRLHRTLAWRENATNPPVASMCIRDSWSYQTPMSLRVSNMEVIYRDGFFEDGLIEIKNDDDTPITVAQYWEHYCFYAKETMNENETCVPGRRIDGTNTYREYYCDGVYTFQKKDHILEHVYDSASESDA